MQKIPFPEHIRGQSPNTSCSKQTHGRRTVRSGIDSFHRRTSGAGIAPEAFHFSGAQTGQADRKGRCPYRWKTDRANCTVAKDTPKTARPKKRQKGPARDANISRSRNRMEVWNLPGSGRQCPYFFEPQPSASAESCRRRQAPPGGARQDTAVRASGARYRRASSHTRSDVVSRTCRTNSPR